MMQVRLLVRSDLERWILNPHTPIAARQELCNDEIGICPIIELLELCEIYRKKDPAKSGRSFQIQLQRFQDGFVVTGRVVFLALDQDRLAEGEGLFENGQLWPPAAKALSPSHSVRRLILRPTEQAWWDGDIYAEAEVIYGALEEMELGYRA